MYNIVLLFMRLSSTSVSTTVLISQCHRPLHVVQSLILLIARQLHTHGMQLTTGDPTGCTHYNQAEEDTCYSQSAVLQQLSQHVAQCSPIQTQPHLSCHVNKYLAITEVVDKSLAVLQP